MTVNICRKLNIDLDNIPDNFEELVQKQFKEYTSLTAKDYRYQDKLAFIDSMAKLSHNADSDDDVKVLIEKRFENALEEYGYITDSDEFYSQSFMRECYELGRDKHRLYSHYFADDYHNNNKIMQLLCKAIKAVMDYEE